MQRPDPSPLTEDDLAQMEHRARRFSGAYTGTSGTLAGDVIRLLAERRRLLVELARIREGGGAYWREPHD
jgi:hypothetical protein